MMIVLSMFFFMQEVKVRAMSRLLNACFAILNGATSFWHIQNFRLIYKKMAFIRRSHSHFYKHQHEYVCMHTVTFLFPSIHQS